MQEVETHKEQSFIKEEIDAELGVSLRKEFLILFAFYRFRLMTF